MFFSHPALMKKTYGMTKKTLYPKQWTFSEILPMSLKNRVTSTQSRSTVSSCTQELQALFGCLKKWEFDDLPCAKQHQLYMDCVHTAEKAASEFREAATKGVLGEGAESGKSVTTAQFNKIMKLFPQPNLGQQPYRRMKRLPTQDYADDLYKRQLKKGKPS